LVEDDRAVSAMLKMLLESREFEVVCAYTGKEVMKHISKDIDLILLDLVLPDQDGLDICRRLKKDAINQHIPIIILSAKFLPKERVEALYGGADDFLTKPFDYEELIARIDVVLRRSKFYQNKQISTQNKNEVYEELRRIIDNELVTPYFQPIYLVKPFKLYGYEALCRPNVNSFLSNPELLFKAALEHGMYQELEMVSWKKAIEVSSKYINKEKLFLNCNPYLVEGDEFNKIKTLFSRRNMLAHCVVLEITERSAISKAKLFYENLKKYRKHGFKFAVDDVGGGYSSLESIVETKPEIVKIDRHIVLGIHKDSFKQSIIRFVVAFCKENDTICIAEGVENKEDFDKVKEMGVDAVQGYYFCKPTSNIKMAKLSAALLPK